jgi:predicted nucleic acid-binding protein
LTILDTNVVSDMMASAPSSAVQAWIAGHRQSGDLFVSTITMAEVFYGVELLPKGRRRERLLREAESMFIEDFAGRVLPFDEPAARVFGAIVAARRAQGRPISTLDAQIAAVARSRDAALATRNTADFEGCGLRLINPWLGESKI